MLELRVPGIRTLISHQHYWPYRCHCPARLFETLEVDKARIRCAITCKVVVMMLNNFSTEEVIRQVCKEDNNQSTIHFFNALYDFTEAIMLMNLQLQQSTNSTFLFLTQSLNVF